MKQSQRVAITLPELGTNRVTFSLWYFQAGDQVREGERIAEVLIPGATIDVAAPVSGTLVERLSLLKDTLTPGQVLGWVEEE